MPLNTLPDGVNQYYEVHGAAGLPIVMAHGGQGNHAQFFQQVAAFSGRHRVVVYDQRGYGMTGGQPNVTGSDENHLDLISLMDHLDIGRALLLGHSLGGWAVSGAAQNAPDRVAGLVMSGTVFNFATDALSRWAAGMIERVRDGFDVLGACHAPDFAEHEPAMAVLFGMLQRLSPARSGPRGIAAYEKMRDQPSRDWSTFSVPTWFVVGERDALTDPSLVASTAVALGAPLEVIAGAGHCTYFEEPDVFNGHLTTILGAL